MSEKRFQMIFPFNYKLSQPAVDTDRQVDQVWGPIVLEKAPCNNGSTDSFLETSFEDEPRSGRITAMYDEDAKAFVGADPNSCIAEKLGVSKSTLADCLKRIRKVEKLDKWVPTIWMTGTIRHVSRLLLHCFSNIFETSSLENSSSTDPGKKKLRGFREFSTTRFCFGGIYRLMSHCQKCSVLFETMHISTESDEY